MVVLQLEEGTVSVRKSYFKSVFLSLGIGMSVGMSVGMYLHVSASASTLVSRTRRS